MKRQKLYQARKFILTKNKTVFGSIKALQDGHHSINQEYIDPQLSF